MKKHNYSQPPDMLDEMKKIAGILVEPGKKAVGFLKVAELSDGGPVKVPVIIANGVREGPTVWIQCCIHGNEVAGTYALLQIWEEIDPQELIGTLVGVPAVNVTAFWQGARIPLFDTKDLNRIMPGDPKGSFTEQYADRVYQACRENGEYLVDLHSAGSIDWALFNADVDVAEESKKLAVSSGFQVIVSDPDGHGGVLDGALFRVMAKEGVPSVILESKDIENLHLALKNILRHLKMIEGTPLIPESQRIFNGFAWGEIVIKHGGLFHPTVEEGEEVYKGQILGKVKDLFGQEVEEIRSSVNGLVMLSPGRKPVKTGDKPFEIAINP